MPPGECDSSVCHGMRRAADIHTRIREPIERIGHLRETTVQRNNASDANGRLSFIAVRPTGALQLECSIIRNVNLLVRAIDKEQVGRERNTTKLIRASKLIKVRCCDSWGVRLPNNASGILSVDTSAVVETDSYGHGP